MPNRIGVFSFPHTKSSLTRRSGALPERMVVFGIADVPQECRRRRDIIGMHARRKRPIARGTIQASDRPISITYSSPSSSLHPVLARFRACGGPVTEHRGVPEYHVCFYCNFTWNGRVNERDTNHENDVPIVLGIASSGLRRTLVDARPPDALLLYLLCLILFTRRFCYRISYPVE